MIKLFQAIVFGDSAIPDWVRDARRKDNGGRIDVRLSYLLGVGCRASGQKRKQDQLPVDRLWTGLHQIRTAAVHFVASDMPLKPAELEKRGLGQCPLAIGGVVRFVQPGSESFQAVASANWSGAKDFF